jgi:hypothetical protein
MGEEAAGDSGMAGFPWLKAGAPCRPPPRRVLPKTLLLKNVRTINVLEVAQRSAGPRASSRFPM